MEHAKTPVRRPDILPAAMIEHTAAGHFRHLHTRSNSVYLLVLCLLIGAFLSLFFIRVPVTVTSQGILTPATVRTTVKSPINGTVQHVAVRENQSVQAGEALVTLSTGAIQGQADQLDARHRDLEGRLNDLRQLTGIRIGEVPELKLQTSLYRRQYAYFKQQLAEHQLTLGNVENEYGRYQKLHEQRVVSDAEFQVYEHAFNQAKVQLHLLYDRQVATWDGDLYDAQQVMQELMAQQAQVDEDRKGYVIVAPASGSIQQFNGVRAGSFIGIGETIATISPDSGLIAEVHVLPSDVGLLHAGMEVRFHVDAFNYNEWGAATGTIMEISDDILVPQQGSPVFVIRCLLADRTLALLNGYEGNLKKGMGVTAHFVVTRRTLFQLLYDKTSDWINPANG